MQTQISSETPFVGIYSYFCIQLHLAITKKDIFPKVQT